MKILLVNPKSGNVDALPIPPLGILYLVSYARERGLGDFKVIDNNREDLQLDVLKKEIGWADIVGLTGTTSQYKQAEEIAAIAKSLNKIVVMGGPHATFLAEEILTAGFVDIVVIGEGEVTFFEILKTIENGGDFSYIDGIVFRKDGKISRTKDRQMIFNLDSIPFPARGLIPIIEYPVRELKQFQGPFTHMMSSRGCIGKCIFCSSPLMWKGIRFRSAENIFQEMLQIHENYGFTNIHFQDDSFTLSRKRVMELCRLIINSGINFRWCCQARPDCVNKELLETMKKAGCVQIAYGVESGDEELLKVANKGYTKEQIRSAFKETNAVGITTYGFFIIGLPGETFKTWIKSILFAKSLHMYCCVWTILVPFPGTKVFNEKMVHIIEPNYMVWRYKNPVIQSGRFGPRTLAIMRKIADVICNGHPNTGTYKTEIKK